MQGGEYSELNNSFDHNKFCRIIVYKSYRDARVHKNIGVLRSEAGVFSACV